MTRLLALLLVAGIGVAAESYVPADHPATLVRRLTAYTEPIRSLDLGAEMAGRISAIAVDVGQRIGGETAVIRLDPVLADLAVEQAEAAVDAAQARIETLNSDRERLRLEAEFAEREYARVSALAAEDRASIQVRDARALDRDRAKVQLAGSDAAVRSAEATLAEAKAHLAEATERRKRHDISAPQGWVVTERLREVGALVNPGEAILRLADVSDLVLAFRLDEAEVAALRASEAADDLSVRFNGRPEPVAARLRRIDVTFDPVSRKRLVEVVVAGTAAPEASGGLAAVLHLAVADGTGALTVPADCVTWRLERAVLRGTDGTEYVVVPLRRTDSGIIISGDALPSGTTLQRNG